MRKLFIAVLLLANLLASSQGRRADDLAAFIQHKTDSLYSAQAVPGIFIGLYNGGEKFFTAGYAVPEAKLRFDSATVFEAGSITKTFTAYILETVLQLRNISDTSSILPYLPDSVRTNKALASISFLSLMNHTSGLPRLPDNLPLNNMAPYDNYTHQQMFDYLKNCTPDASKKSSYSNLGMGLAGVLAAQIGGQDYKTLLETHILKAFAMKDALNERSKKAQGFFEQEAQPFWKMNSLYPAGGAQCSARDMLAYLKSMSVAYSDTNAQGLVIKKLLAPTASLTSEIQICKGWHTLQQKDKPVIYWHNGGTYGFSTFAAFTKDTKQAVIVVVNQFSKNNISDGLGIAIMNKMLE